MGWLSNIFKLKGDGTSEKSEVQYIHLNEFTKILEDKVQDKNFMMEDELKKMHKKMLESSRNFSVTLANLKSSPGPSKVDTRVMNVINSYRITIVKGFNKMFIDFDKPVSYTVRDFDNYFKKCMSSLKDAENSVNRFINPLKEVFPGSMNNLLKRSKNLSDVMAKINSDLIEKSGGMRPVINALNASKNLDSDLRKISNTESELEEMKSSIEGMKIKKKSIEQKVSNLKNNDDWKSYQDKMREIESIEKKKDEIRSVVLQTIVPIDKGMKRLKKLLSDGKDSFEHADMLDLYIEDPVSAFLKDKDQTIINKVILKIKSVAESGNLEMNDKKGQKVLNKISSMESDNLLSGFRKGYDDLEENKRKLEEETKSAEITNVKLQNEKELEDVESKISQTEEKLKETEDILKRMVQKKKETFETLKGIENEVLGSRIRLRSL